MQGVLLVCETCIMCRVYITVRYAGCISQLDMQGVLLVCETGSLGHVPVLRTLMYTLITLREREDRHTNIG